jgi:glycosyltransferase involved in cell wall biosynthesis
MKIVFVSDFLNHHQTTLCDNIHSQVDTFYFIHGYSGKGSEIKRREEREYTMLYKDNPEKAKEEILSADAVIFGSCPNRFIDMRMRENKLSFVYSERLFKKSILQMLKVKNYKAIKQRFLDYKDKNLYVLAASAYLSYDLSHYNFPTEKILKWGYFPEMDKSEPIEKKENSILFTGRFLDWKHTETVIETARLLKNDKIICKVSLIGDGPEREKLKNLVNKYNLNDCVEFLGVKTHRDVMQMMAEHEIFMFTSDYQEGWGAVLNEAMANGCAVVASSAAGSTPFLVKHNQNGKIYKYGNHIEAFKAVKELFLNKEETERFCKNAIQTIENEYNGEIAAKRLVQAVKEFNDTGLITPCEGGILSQAEIIKNNWFKP